MNKTGRKATPLCESSSDSVLHNDMSQASTDLSDHMEEELGARVPPPVIGQVIPLSTALFVETWLVLVWCRRDI